MWFTCIVELSIPATAKRISGENIAAHSMLPQPPTKVKFPSFFEKIFADFLLFGSVISQFREYIVKECPFYRQSLKYSVHKIRTFAAVSYLVFKNYKC
jgi:hypothetical protein